MVVNGMENNFFIVLTFFPKNIIELKDFISLSHIYSD